MLALIVNPSGNNLKCYIVWITKDCYSMAFASAVQSIKILCFIVWIHIYNTLFCKQTILTLT